MEETKETPRQDCHCPPPKKGKTAVIVSVAILGALIIIGALAFLSQGFWTVPTINGNTVSSSSNGVEEIRMVVNGASYQPSTLTVTAGSKVQWLVDGTKAIGCTSYLLSPELGISKRLNKGSNMIEFTAPTKKGSYEFSCSMNMVKGKINVI